MEVKHEFEGFCVPRGVDIKNHQADNRACNSNLFRQSCAAAGQGLCFSGVNSHYQNSVAERKIGCIANLARTMMLHAMILWTSHAPTNSWPFVMKHATDFHKARICNSRLSPIADTFTGLKNSFYFAKFHAFGSPAFVLEPSLQSANKTPRWNPMSKLGMCLGKISEYAGIFVGSKSNH